MGYEVEAYEDLTWKDTMSRIKEFSTSERLKKTGCAVVVVSSHGGTDPSSFLTSDGEEVSVSHLHRSFIKDQSKEDDHVVLFREVQNRYQEKGMGTTPEIQNLGFSKTFYFHPRPSKRSRNHSQEVKALSVTMQVGINGSKQKESIGNHPKQKSQMYKSLCFRLQQPHQFQGMRPQRNYIWNKTE
ncbi:hypothetical protein E2C01_065478 [Portunus trituberculatus]|uniref:Caspase family p20 domain-containing protein n=1 Tax=Portunus trituberculatus TaxID=210409 RepID=A0A5B7HMP2_PORTR|nr:hypothetical protein [Portunus trituberculatus]